MLGFKDVIGHEHLIEHLQSAITMGKVSHAYIFDGEKGRELRRVPLQGGYLRVRA